MQEDFKKKDDINAVNDPDSGTDFYAPAAINGNTADDDDCVEAEIVYEGGDSVKNRSYVNEDRYRGKTGHAGFSGNAAGAEKAVNRIKTMFRGLGGIMLVLGLLLATGGIFLSATVIGIIFGIPMIIAGVFLIWLGISLIGGGNTVVYKRTGK